MTLMTFDAATIDSTGAFLISELERLDQTLHMPLASVTWSRDIKLRTDVMMGDELSSFTNSAFASAGGTTPGGKSWIGKNSNGLTSVALDIGKTASPLTLWGKAIGYTLPELASAMQLGRPIDAQKMEGMQLLWQMDIDAMVYTGDSEIIANGATVPGLFNNLSINTANVVNGASASPLWKNKTPQEILADIRSMEVAIWTATGFAFAMRELRIPPAQMVALLQPMAIGGTTLAVSILEYLQNNSLCMQENGVPLSIKAVKWLVGAGAGATDRMCGYINEYDKVRFPMVPLQRTPLEYRGIEQITNYYGRLGVVEIPRLETVAYRDGI